MALEDPLVFVRIGRQGRLVRNTQYEEIRAIFQTYTDLVEPVASHEAYPDVTSPFRQI